MQKKAKPLRNSPKLRLLRPRKGKGRSSSNPGEPILRTKDVILVLDFGSQYTQLIARRIREHKVFSKIVPYNISPEEVAAMNPKGLIFSGGPLSVYDKDAPLPHRDLLNANR